MNLSVYQNKGLRIPLLNLNVIANCTGKRQSNTKAIAIVVGIVFCHLKINLATIKHNEQTW